MERCINISLVHPSPFDSLSLSLSPSLPPCPLWPQRQSSARSTAAAIDCADNKKSTPSCGTKPGVVWTAPFVESFTRCTTTRAPTALHLPHFWHGSTVPHAVRHRAKETRSGWGRSQCPRCPSEPPPLTPSLCWFWRQPWAQASSPPSFRWIVWHSRADRCQGVPVLPDGVLAVNIAHCGDCPGRVPFSAHFRSDTPNAPLRPTYRAEHALYNAEATNIRHKCCAQLLWLACSYGHRANCVQMRCAETERSQIFHSIIPRAVIHCLQGPEKISGLAWGRWPCGIVTNDLKCAKLRGDPHPLVSHFLASGGGVP